MASQCVYTGALVYFTDLDMAVRADVFTAGDQVVIQWGAPGQRCDEAIVRGAANGRAVATHIACVDDGYHHEKRGITIVNRRNFEGEFR